MNFQDIYYALLETYNSQFFWLGFLFTITAPVVIFFAYGPSENPRSLKAWMSGTLLWVTWGWLFGTVWLEQMMMPLTILFVLNSISIVLLTVVAVFIFVDIFTESRVQLYQPVTTWEGVVAAIFIVIGLGYPFYMVTQGLDFPSLMFVGLAPVPTLMIVGALLAFGTPGVKTWLVWALFFVALETLVSSALIGLSENYILIPLVLYMAFELIFTKRKLEIWNESEYAVSFQGKPI